jgi:nickel-dependent lactate racemase
MKVSFPYPEMKPLDVPDENLLGIYSPSQVGIDKSEEEIIKEGLGHPAGGIPLSEVMKGCRSVLILTDDYTRTTPVKKILPPLLKELRRNGMRDDRIRILIASGTHRPMTGEEISVKFGTDLPKQYPVLNHHWWDSSQLIHLGETDQGTPILVNKIVRETDFIIGIGQIVPHRVSGFSGEANIVQPGISGEEPTGKTHWLSARFKGREILGKIENPVKEENEKVALKAGLRWIINTIQDGSGRVVDIVTGDPLKAYRLGAARSREIYQASLPQEADIVIADSHPYDTDLWVASKGIYAAELAVKEGGVVILVSPCPEGVCPSHPEVLEIGYHSFEEVDGMVRNGKIKKLTVAAHLVHVGRVVKERATGMMISRGISKEETERLGLLYAREPQEALERAFSLLSKNAKVAVLQRGGEILPVIRNG